MKKEYQLCVIGAAAALAIVLSYWLNRPPAAPKTNEAVAIVQNESDRLERIAGLVEEKVKAEVKSNEKIAVRSDDVLGALDGLLSRSRR